MSYARHISLNLLAVPLIGDLMGQGMRENKRRLSA